MIMKKKKLIIEKNPEEYIHNIYNIRKCKILL